jgi:hypothetical protein
LGLKGLVVVVVVVFFSPAWITNQPFNLTIDRQFCQ